MQRAQFVSIAMLLVSLGVFRGVEAQTKFVAEGDTWRYFKGTEEPPVEWNTLGFDDSSWLEGATPIGYSGDLVYKTVLSDMQQAGTNPGYWSVYTRKKFTVDDPSAVKLLKLSMKYDDGFVAYLNGKEVARASMPGTAGTPVLFNAAAASHETNAAFEYFILPCTAIGEIKTGDNVLAVQGNNVNLPSSDFSLDPELESSTDFCPTAFTAAVAADKKSIRVTWKIPTGVTYEALTLTRNEEDLTITPSTIFYSDRFPVIGDNKYVLTATLCSTNCAQDTTVKFEGEGEKFRRGDADAGGGIPNLTDAVFTLNYLFMSGATPTCPDAADADDNGQVSITDAVYLLNYLFMSGPQPPSPGPDTCGPDVDITDTLGPCVYTTC